MTTSLHRKDYTPGARGPLNGIRVLDLSRLVCGNQLTQVLGDFGAHVIKVEPPTGDTLRDWVTNGVTINWTQYARNKKSLCVDFRNSETRDLLLRLAETAQIFVESFRPGALEEMGLAPDVLLARNPKLIIIRISGWGQTGPYRRRPGFGTLIEGMSGFASSNGFEDREPVLPPAYLADSVAGLYGASAALVALREVETNGGRGQVIDLPLLDPLVAILGPQAANYRLTGEVKKRVGSRSTHTAPRNAYKCKDGRYVCLSASIQKMAERVFTSIGRADLIDNPRYKTNADRVKHAHELDEIIGTFVATRTQAENVAFFEKAEVTIGPIYDNAQILEDPHFADREIIAEYPDPVMGSYPMTTVVPRFSETPGSIRTRAPELGADNRAVLSEIGIDDAAYVRLQQAGVVRAPKSKGKAT
jgi:crotonobetainyl-CoA:carnitine CoA-transferase CaiB-like acyl-CoA transferase